jgi:hypothetical protein
MFRNADRLVRSNHHVEWRLLVNRNRPDHVCPEAGSRDYTQIVFGGHVDLSELIHQQLPGYELL